MSSLIITKLLTFFHEIDKVNDYTIDRQTDDWTDRQTYIETYRKTEKQMDIPAYNGKIYKLTDGRIDLMSYR